MSITRIRLLKHQMILLARYLIENKESLHKKTAAEIALDVNRNCEGITNCTAYHVKEYAKTAGLEIMPTRTKSESAIQGHLTRAKVLQDRIDELSGRVDSLLAKNAELERQFKNIADLVIVVNRKHAALATELQQKCDSWPLVNKRVTEHGERFDSEIRQVWLRVDEIENAITKPEQRDELAGN